MLVMDRELLCMEGNDKHKMKSNVYTILKQNIVKTYLDVLLSFKIGVSFLPSPLASACDGSMVFEDLLFFELASDTSPLSLAIVLLYVCVLLCMIQSIHKQRIMI